MSTISLNLPADQSAANAQAATKRGIWPFAGVIAGLTGAASTFVFTPTVAEGVHKGGVEAVYAALHDQSQVRIGATLGFISILALVVFATGLVRHLKSRVSPDSSWLNAFRMALTAGIGTLVIGYSFKDMLAGGMPGGIDESFYTHTDVAVLDLLTGQLQWAAWWPVAIAMMATVGLAFKERALPRWLGAVSAVFSAFVLIMTLGIGLPYSAGIAAPIWLIVAGIGGFFYGRPAK